MLADLEVLKALQSEVNRRLGNIENDLKDKYATHTDLKHISDKLEALENTKVWIVRLVLGAFVLQVLAITFSSKIQNLIG